MSSSGKEYFYPRSPCGERQAPPCYNLMIHQNFYPRSPCGERLNLTFHQRGCIIFLSTLSLRRATPPSITPTASRRYFYPRSPCGERLIAPLIFSVQPRNFYPRSPCGERPELLAACTAIASISIHALLAESDRRAFYDIARHIYFYPRSPCGERLNWLRTAGVEDDISIHALLAESDCWRCNG